MPAVAFERTLVLIKPDAVARGLVGEVLSRFERKGLGVAGLKMMRLDERTAEVHYAEHRGRAFYEGLLRFITSGPLVAMVLEGKECIQTVRTMVGPTSGRAAPPGTIRGDFGMSDRHNLVHASDCAESARREIGLFFAEGDLFEPPIDPWVYDRTGQEPI